MSNAPTSQDVDASVDNPAQPPAADTVEQEDVTPSAEELAQARANLMARWGSLPAERHQLIRMAPLPADRETGLRPVMFASLGRVSRHSETLSMLKLTVELPTHKVGPDFNCLEVWIDHVRQEVSFLPEEGLRTEPANRGLGRFLLAQASRWINQKCSHYSVKSMPLLVKLVSNDSARLRRDYALQAQGFTVDYGDALQLSATCTAAQAKVLHTAWNEKKIRIIETAEIATILQTAEKDLRGQEKEINQLTAKLERLQSDDNVMRFTITMLVIFSVFQAALLIWMAIR